MLVIQMWNGEFEDGGSSFLVNKKGKIYLVTCYHIVPGYEFLDTSLLHGRKSHAPDVLSIFFHSKNREAPPILTKCTLYTNNKRNFFTVPIIHGAMIGNGDREVFDLAFIPLNMQKLPKDALIDTVPLYDKDVIISKGNLISMWGFEDSLKNQYPSIDTGIITKQKYNPNEGQINEWAHSFYSIHKDIEGNSGCPVFVHLSDGAHFVGIHSLRVIDMQKNVPEAFRDGTPNQEIGSMITKQFIRYALENFVP